MNIEMAAIVSKTEENMMIVEEKLVAVNTLVMEDGDVETFYRGEENIKYFEKNGREEKILLPKGIIHVGCGGYRSV